MKARPLHAVMRAACSRRFGQAQPPARWLSLLALSCMMTLPGTALAQRPDPLPTPLQAVGLDQRLGEQVPLDLRFRDEAGRWVRLADHFADMPVILVPAYYTCGNLCPLALDGLVKGLRALSLSAGEHFTVIAVSIDPRDTPALAAKRKATYVGRYSRRAVPDGWHFLTGEAPAIQELARSIGFRYAADPGSEGYAHASGLLILTPRGRISRYLYGIEYSPRDLRLALVEASGHRIGSLVDQVLLRCYRYDPATGTYGLAIMNAVRFGGLVTVLALGSFIVAMVRREPRRRPPE